MISKHGSALTSLFPTPAAIADGNFAGLSISKSRVDALRKLARAVVDGTVDYSASSECVIESITKVLSNRSMAEYIALRALGEPDAFPSNDLVLRMIVNKTDRPLSAHQLEARSDAWRPWRGYAALHLWCAAVS